MSKEGALLWLSSVIRVSLIPRNIRKQGSRVLKNCCTFAPPGWQMVQLGQAATACTGAFSHSVHQRNIQRSPSPKPAVPPCAGSAWCLDGSEVPLVVPKLAPKLVSASLGVAAS